MSILQTSSRLVTVWTGVTYIIVLESLLYVKGDSSVCQELRDYAKDLNYLQSDTAGQYAPARSCPEEYKFVLNNAESCASASENINLLDDFIGELRHALELEEPKSCLSRTLSHVCVSVKRRRNQFKIALTFASFYKAGRLFREGLIVLALIEIERLKMMRTEMEGVAMHEVFTLEDASLKDLADACENDPQEALGVIANSSDRWVESVYRRLMTLTDPDAPGNRRGQERETMELVHRVIEYSYQQLHKEDDNLINPLEHERDPISLLSAVLRLDR